MFDVFEDLSYGLRALARNRGFAVVAVLSLALGIGANTTVFTLINAVLLRPLAVQDARSLVMLYTQDPRNPGLLPCSYPNFQDYRDHNDVFASLLLYSTVSISLTGRGEPRPILGQLVTANYFSALGVKMAAGRGFAAEEDVAPGASPVAVIGYGLWMRQFGGDPQVTSRAIGLNGRAYNIVGVAPPDFNGLSTLFTAEVWAPAMMYPQLFPSPSAINQRRALVFSVAGRLKPGVSIQQAQAAMQSLARDLERQYPRDNQSRGIVLAPLTESLINQSTRTTLTNAGAVLMAVAVLVLLIACANVANLLLARARARRKEISVRLAMGASRMRLVRQLLTESALLSLLGGALGLVAARWARDILWAARPPILSSADFQIHLDGRVLVFAFLISIATTILFGLVPALSATRLDLASWMKVPSGDRSGGKSGLKPALVISQVALSVVALVGAGLFVHSLRSAEAADTGFDAPHLGVVAFNLSSRGYNEARGREFERQAIERVLRAPGVDAATLAKDPPFRVSQSRTILLAGQESLTNGAGRVTMVDSVLPGYFRVLGIPVLRGRDFNELDTGTAPRVAIVNEAAAARFWPEENPVGKRFRFAGDNASVEVIGVVRNANYLAIGEQPQAMVYGSLIQNYSPMGALDVRMSGDLEAVLAGVRRQVQALDPDLLLQSRTVAGMIHNALWAPRLAAGLLSVFGALALLLTIVGIYGLISYSVNQRVREIGVRMALGATTANVERMILGEAVRLAGGGIGVGLAAAWAGSRLVKNMLFGAGSTNGVIYMAAPSILAAVALLAGWLPARGATRIQPGQALRHD